MMKTSSFPISFWHSMSLESIDDKRFADIVDFGTTVLMSPYVADTPDAHKLAARLLDRCAEAGIGVMLCDAAQAR